MNLIIISLAVMFVICSLCNPGISILVGPKCYKCPECADGKPEVSEYCRPGEYCGAYKSGVITEDGTRGIAIFRGCVNRQWRDKSCEEKVRLLAEQEGGPDSPWFQRLTNDSLCCMGCFSDLCNDEKPSC